MRLIVRVGRGQLIRIISYEGETAMPPPLIIDTGNTAFMLLCSSLVMLMTPGLAFFYGGLVGLGAGLLSSFWAFVFSYLMLWIIARPNNTKDLQPRATARV